VLDVREWAEIRRMHEVDGLSIREISRRTGHDRNTVRRALRREGPPVYRRPSRPSKLDPHKPRIHELLRSDPKIPASVIRERIQDEEGYAGGKTILEDYVRELRPVFCPPRTFQRTAYRPGEICQLDLWEPQHEIPVGHGQTRRGFVVVAVMGYSRAGAGALIFSKRLEDIAWGINHCLRQLGGLAKTLVFDREGALHAGEGRPTEAFAAYLGQLAVGWHFCDPRDPQAKGVV
jgi:transposase